MNTEEQTQPIKEQLGVTLKTLRETASFSIESVAKSLNLKPSIIEDIEGRLDEVILEKTYSTVFLRGYLQSYAKFIGLKSIENFSEFKMISLSQKDEVTFKEPIKQKPAKASKRKVPFVAFIIIAIVALGIYLSGVLSGNSSVVSPTLSKTNATVKVNDVIQKIKIKTSPETKIVKDDQQAPEMMDLHKGEKSVNKPITEENKVTNVAKKEKTETAEVKEVISKPELAVKTAQLKKATLETLKISFSDDCWTEIYDANNKRIAFGLYKRGRTIYPKGIAPFKLQLGDPGVVTIMRGKKEVHHNFPAGKKAYITLQPLSN